MNRLLWIALSLLVVATGTGSAGAQPTGSNWLYGKPVATIDLTTKEGVAAVGGQWRYHDAAAVSIKSPSIGGDLKPSGPTVATNDIEPKAGAADFDDSQWQVIDPPTPMDRYGAGRLSFAWFRFQITIPESVATISTKGTTIVL
jgi:hypothetical protein